MIYQFIAPLVFLLLAVLFVAAMIVVPKLIRIQNRYPGKTSIYECGEEAIGSSWIRFNLRFYVVAIIFIIFEVEVLFLIPWAVVFRDMSLPVGTVTPSGVEAIGFLAFMEVFVFVLILVVGLAYVWNKGYLDWVLEKTAVPTKPKHVITKEQRRAA